MKIWKEFNSSHSSNISIVGKFENAQNADKAFEMIEDFTLAAWEERYPSIDEFKQHWAVKFDPDLPYIQICEDDFLIGVDNAPDIEIHGDTIKINRLRSPNIGGIVKLMRFSGARKIEISEGQS